jgi:hypothetical protein
MVNGVAGILGLLCVGMVGVAIQGWFYFEALDWWGAIAPEGHQDWVYVRPWVGQGQVYFIRYSFAPAVRDQFVRSVHGRIQKGDRPLTGLEFFPPERFDPANTQWFFKEHRLFGLFSFGLRRIDFDLAKDWGGKPHVMENGYEVMFPMWFPAFMLGLLPGTLVFQRWREKGRSVDGFCAKCGYDLRGTPERCPECGRKPAH